MLAFTALAGGCALSAPADPQPLPAGLTTGLKRLPAPAGADNGTVILHETGAGEAARQAARALPGAVQQTARALGVPARSVWPTPLVACFSPGCAQQWGLNPFRRAAVTRSRVALVIGPLASDRPEAMVRLLRHELVHVVFRRRLGRGYWRIPGWFHEGLAVHLSGQGGEGVSDARAQRRLRRGDHFTFACIRDPLSFGRGFGARDHLRYRQAGLFVGHLTGLCPACFRRMVGQILAGARLCPAFETAFGRSLPLVWRQFKSSRASPGGG